MKRFCVFNNQVSSTLIRNGFSERGFDMFDEMTANIQEDTIRLLYHVKIEQKVEREQVAKVTGTNKDDSAPAEPKKRAAAKIYPNDPCPCGSGKKYKQCCGRFAE
jgi:preprotein translocase subunit SecA